MASSTPNQNLVPLNIAKADNPSTCAAQFPISGREVGLAENGDSEGPIQITWTYYAQTADLGVPEPRPPVELPILPRIVPLPEVGQLRATRGDSP
jgi:hypothetical protein